MINVSIVTYKTDRDEISNILENCSSSVINKIYIIDNSPNDLLREFLKAKKIYNLEYIFNPENPGYGASHNIAIRKSITNNINYHLVINSDLKFEKSILDNLENFMEKNKDIGLISPKIYNLDGTVQTSCRLLPSPLDIFLRIFPKYLRSRFEEKYLLKGLGNDRSFLCSCVSGCFMFLRTETLKKVSLFDDRFFLYAEDVDLSRRIAEESKILFYPKFSIVHFYRGESKKNIKMFFIHCLSLCKYFYKWGWFVDLKRKQMNLETIGQIKK